MIETIYTQLTQEEAKIIFVVSVTIVMLLLFILNTREVYLDRKVKKRIKNRIKEVNANIKKYHYLATDNKDNSDYYNNLFIASEIVKRELENLL